MLLSAIAAFVLGASLCGEKEQNDCIFSIVKEKKKTSISNILLGEMTREKKTPFLNGNLTHSNQMETMVVPFSAYCF